MKRRKAATENCVAAIGAVVFAVALLCAGCAGWRERDDFAAPPKKSSDEVQLRPRGEVDAPFWYSSKSRDIEASLGGSAN